MHVFPISILSSALFVLPAFAAGPSDFNCIGQCLEDVSSANSTCSARAAGTTEQNWCVCETPSLKIAMRPCLSVNCTADALEYFFQDCELNFDGKPDPHVNGARDHDGSVATRVRDLVSLAALTATVLLVL